MRTTKRYGETRSVAWPARMVREIHRKSCGWKSSSVQRRTRECFSSEPRGKVVSGKHSMNTHFPKDRNCDICMKTNITRTPWRKRTGAAILRAVNLGDLITADHKVLSEGCESRNNHRHAVVVQDLATHWIQSYPCKTKKSQETEKSLQKFLEPTRKPIVIYTDNSMEFGKACEDLSWSHCTSTRHRSETNGIAERAVRRIKEDTSAVLMQSGVGEKWWADSMDCYCYLRNVTDLLSDGKKPHMRDVWETIWRTDHLVHWLSIPLSLRRTSPESINLERKYYLDCSSDTLCTRVECGRVTYWSQTLRSFNDSVADGRIKLPGGDQDLRASTLIWDNFDRGEEQGNLPDESDGSPPPQDSSPDDGESRNDFWSISGNYFYRHHVEPRVKLYVPRGESFPIPTIHYRDQSYKYDFGCGAWEPQRRLLEYRVGPRFISRVVRFHTIHNIGWKNLQMGIHAPGSGWQSNKRHPGLTTCGQRYGKTCQKQRNEKKNKNGLSKNQRSTMQEGWEVVISSIQQMRRSRPLFKNARRKLEVSMPAAVPCKITGRKYRETCSTSYFRKTKYACVVEADESTIKRLEGTPHKDHEDHNQRNTLRCRLGCFCPFWGPPTPQKLVHFFVFFAALNLAVICNVMGHVNVLTDCHLRSCYTLLCPSQSRVSLRTWRLPRRFKNASELWRRCSTPQHAQHAGPHTYIPTLATGTPTEQHTTKPSTRQPQHGGGRRLRRAWRLCPGWPVFWNLVLLFTNLRVHVMFSNFPKEFWQTCEHTGRIWRVQTTFITKYFLSKLKIWPS